MILKGPFSNLSSDANTTLVFINAKRISHFLEDKYSLTSQSPHEKGEELFKFIEKALIKIFEWIVSKSIKSKWFETNILDFCIENYMGYYHDKYNPKEYHILNCCYHAIAFSCLTMIEYDRLKGLYPMDYFPSSLQEYPGRIHECLSSAQQASEDPEAEKIWQDQIIARLLKDHHTEDPNDFGENISREYIEELLGEKLPF